MANHRLNSITKHPLTHRSKMNHYRKLYSATGLERHFVLVKKYSVLALLDKAGDMDATQAKETVH